MYSLVIVTYVKLATQPNADQTILSKLTKLCQYKENIQISNQFFNSVTNLV